MGVVSDLSYDVRDDIIRHCPPETLKQYDVALTQICEWESQDLKVSSINLLWSFNITMGVWIAALIFGLFVGYNAAIYTATC